MPDTPPNLYSRQARGIIGTVWFWSHNAYTWYAAKQKWWWHPAPHPPVYKGMAAYQLTLRALWTTEVNKALWRPLAKRYGITAYNAFQKINMIRYHNSQPPITEPP